jgi:hypothetical protein
MVTGENLPPPSQSQKCTATNTHTSPLRRISLLYRSRHLYTNSMPSRSLTLYLPRDRRAAILRERSLEMT